jgi:hypothetical protein
MTSDSIHAAERAPTRRDQHAEAEERAVRDRLVEGVPTALARNRPPHRGADPHRERDGRTDEEDARATNAWSRDAAECDREQRRRQDDHRRASDGEHSTDVRRISCEDRPGHDRTHQGDERDDPEAGRPDGRIRRRIHGRPR